MQAVLSRRAVMSMSLATSLALFVESFGASATAAEKPIQFILPFSAGSGVDIIIRAAQHELSRALNAPIVISNQPGSGGIVGTQLLVKAAADGKTIGIISNNHVVYPNVLKSLPFDPIDDITPIAVVGSTPFVMVTNPTMLLAETLFELTAHLKANPGKHLYGSSGNGTILHLAAALYIDQAGLRLTHIPYKGVSPLVTDLVAGQVDMAVLPYPAVVSHIRSGALRAIGVGSAKRMKAEPNIPTFIEQGMPSYLIEGWFAAVGPARLPPSEIERCHKAFTAAFATDDVKAAMAKQANTIAITSTEQARDFVKAELAKYKALVTAMKLKPQ